MLDFWSKHPLSGGVAQSATSLKTHYHFIFIPITSSRNSQRPSSSTTLVAIIAGSIDRGSKAKQSKAMASPVVRRSSGGFFEGFYRLIVRRTPVYVTFVIAGAFAGERAVDYGVHKLWEYNNVGKRYEDISVLGTRQAEE